MRSTIAALALAALVAGCGSDTGDGDVTGQEPTSPRGSGSPTGPPWPEFAHDDYTFVYSSSCFCPDGGVRIAVTVRDGEVVDAVYAEAGPGHAAGAPADQPWQQITMDDVIDLANTENAATVDVNWPADQDYPDKVWVDRDERMVDEEMGYRIHRVQIDG